MVLLDDAGASPFGRTRQRSSRPQQRFWVLDRLDPGNPALNVAVRWRLDGQVQTSVLEQAWRVLLRRHEGLRSFFAEIGGEPWQIVEPSATLDIREIDLSGLAPDAARAEADRVAQAEARRPFDLNVAPLLRVARLRLDVDRSILLVTAHHIICDGWSIGVLAGEMGEICAAICDRRAAALPELSIQYGDYADWQRECLARTDQRRSIQFWTRMMTGLPFLDVLPDRPRELRLHPEGRIASSLLDRALTDAAVTVAKGNNCSLFMVCYAALLVLLHRQTGEIDIPVGTQVAGRDLVETETLVGPFINTLVLRGDLAGDPPFAALLDRVRELVSAAFEYKQTPLEQLIELAPAARRFDRAGLFSVNFIFQRSFIRNANYGPFDLVDLPSFSAGALYDLNFFMVERPEGWRFSCEYDPALFDAATVEGLLLRFQTILRAVVDVPSCRVSRIPLLQPDERRALIALGQGAAAPFPRDCGLPALLEEQARRTPDATAVVCAGRALSFGELDAAANQLAQELAARGHGSGARIGVMLQRSTDLVVALLAVLKSGAAYVPLDPFYPPARIRDVVDDAGMACVIAQEAFAGSVPGTTPTLLLDRQAGAIAARPTVPPHEATPGADDVAYVIYTSGSTGRPKGVQIQHRALVNFLFAMRASPGLASSDTLVGVTTVAFDIAGLEIFLPLLTGARLVLATEAEAGEGAALLTLLRRSAATVLQATPVTWQLLIEAGWKGHPRVKMLCGGEALPRVLADSLLARGDELWNLYGPTETTIWSSAARVDPGPIRIGAPIANTQFYILDEHHELAPPGVPGELYIGGDGVALGYLGRPDLTAERFVSDTYSDRPGGRLYRTGDLVRRRNDGGLEFLGRSDQQVKLRGFRIELGEIETVLGRHPWVSEAAAAVGPDGSGEPALRAYVVLRPEAGEDWQGALRAQVRGALPAYMVPSVWEALPSLPRTPNGKLDRRALPKPSLSPPTARVARAYIESGAIERRLARLWREVLGIDEIPPDVSFFELGGHSLLAARLLAKIEAEFERRLSLATLFTESTLAELAALLARPERRLYEFSQVIKLQPNGSRLPILALNQTGVFYALSRRLGPDQPFTALQLFDPARVEQHHPASIEEAAAEYVELIRRAEPSGPYVLFGWCIAATVAFEAARQLTAAGAEVALLVLVDGWEPGYRRRLRWFSRLLADASYRAQVIAADWRDVRAGRYGLHTFLIRRDLLDREGRARRRRTLARALARLRDTDERAGVEYHEWIIDSLRRFGERYVPTPYAGRTMILRAQLEPHGRFLDDSLGWAPFLTGQVDIHEIVGDHSSIFRDPGVGEIARFVGAAVQEEMQRRAARKQASPAAELQSVN